MTKKLDPEIRASATARICAFADAEFAASDKGPRAILRRDLEHKRAEIADIFASFVDRDMQNVDVRALLDEFSDFTGLIAGMIAGNVADAIGDQNVVIAMTNMVARRIMTVGAKPASRDPSCGTYIPIVTEN